MSAVFDTVVLLSATILVVALLCALSDAIDWWSHWRDRRDDER